MPIAGSNKWKTKEHKNMEAARMREAKRAKLLAASAPQPAAKVLLIAFMTMFCNLSLKWALGDREYIVTVENKLKMQSKSTNHTEESLTNLTFNPLNMCPCNFSTVTDKSKLFLPFFPFIHPLYTN